VIAYPRPVALAVVHFGEHLTDRERRAARVDLALKANDEGYALAEMFEIDPRRFRELAVLAAFAELAERLDASHVFIAGDVDRSRVEEIADDVRMTVEWMPRIQPAGSGVAPDQTRSKLST
jgi:hypothetical protein